MPRRGHDSRRYTCFITVIALIPSFCQQQRTFGPIFLLSFLQNIIHRYPSILTMGVCLNNALSPCNRVMAIQELQDLITRRLVLADHRSCALVCYLWSRCSTALLSSLLCTSYPCVNGNTSDVSTALVYLRTFSGRTSHYIGKGAELPCVHYDMAAMSSTFALEPSTTTASMPLVNPVPTSKPSYWLALRNPS